MIYRFAPARLPRIAFVVLFLSSKSCDAELTVEQSDGLKYYIASHGEEVSSISGFQKEAVNAMVDRLKGEKSDGWKVRLIDVLEVAFETLEIDDETRRNAKVAIREHLNDESPSVRTHVLTNIAREDGARASDIYAKAAVDVDEGVSSVGILLLGKYADARYVAALEAIGAKRLKGKTLAFGSSDYWFSKEIESAVEAMKKRKPVDLANPNVR